MAKHQLIRTDPFSRLTEIQQSLGSLHREFNQILDDLRMNGAPPAPHALRHAGRARKHHIQPRQTLQPAVAAVLRAAKRPLKCREIYDALVSSGYSFTQAEPIKMLCVRLYTLPGVRRRGRGLFTLDKRTKASNGA